MTETYFSASSWSSGLLDLLLIWARKMFKRFASAARGFGGGANLALRLLHRVLLAVPDRELRRVRHWVLECLLHHRMSVPMVRRKVQALVVLMLVGS